MLDREELRKRVYQFLKKYGDDYSKLNLEESYFLEMSIANYIGTFYNDAYYNPISRDNAFFQIFSAIEAYSPDINPYYHLAKIIENEYGLDRNIIEVGGGMFPSLAIEIAKKQQEIGKGTISVYDPNLVPKALNGITLVDTKFTLSTPLPENCLLVGRKPCQATEIMIEAANRQEKEFLVQLCTCDHTPITYRRNRRLNHSHDTWIKYLNELIASTLPKDFVIEESTFTDPLVKTKEKIINSRRIGHK